MVLDLYPFSDFEGLVGGDELGRGHVCENVPVSDNNRHPSKEQYEKEHVDRYRELTEHDDYSEDPDGPRPDLLETPDQPGRNGPRGPLDDDPVKPDDQKGDEKSHDDLKEFDGETACQEVENSWKCQNYPGKTFVMIALG